MGRRTRTGATAVLIATTIMSAALAAGGGTAMAAPNGSPSAPSGTTVVKGFRAPAGSVADGKWIVTPGGAKISLVAMGYSDCPGERLCLFEHANYEGRMVQFPNFSKLNLGDYGFDDVMTSFVNNLANDASWFEWRHGVWFNPSHCMQSNSSSPIVAPNDTATAIETWNSNNSC